MADRTQHGTFVYNGDYSPGNKSDGGLSQNLYNDDGQLMEHGSFFPDVPEPDDQQEPEADSSDDLYGALALAVAAIIGVGVGLGIKAAAPHAQRWWLDRALPKLRSLSARQPKNTPDDTPKSKQERPALLNIADSSAVAAEIDRALDTDGLEMSPEEARQRLVFLLLFSALAAEQEEILRSARIKDPILQEALTRLSSPMVLNSLNQYLSGNIDRLAPAYSDEMMRCFQGGTFRNGTYVPLLQGTVRDALHLSRPR